MQTFRTSLEVRRCVQVAHAQPIKVIYQCASLLEGEEAVELQAVRCRGYVSALAQLLKYVAHYFVYEPGIQALCLFCNFSILYFGNHIILFQGTLRSQCANIL